ncbi:DUF551 domain-containing protein [Citrobacter freundii]|uniref:DUF551 domain-containing protein n=1 Tax=Citrobacter freundii TaxID=546 RepID=UPI001AC6EBD9|nr:DUF551 domain-containing protein [Citrobacter freundii]MDH0215532.1 DUF551 domain-containing protein [Citrobacter freundii]MDH0227611.1 DUF551 domain-containing protein [Citrobacter freundii]MDH0244090.1 DUF551 domain-containing protein [Citrobacter freundii]MDH0984976.1 DUF551 domain-containing protein [Citrobacter freundii]MDH1348538.1 DUF551 domain-containing protein [Citrobacter freundii]
MSTITKQWLQQKIADMEAIRDEIPFGLDEDDSNTLAALRIALASLEAVPVGEVSEQRDGLVMDGMVDLGGASTHRIIKGASKMKRLPLGTKFYTAPPAPVSVPAAMEMDDDFDSSFEHGKAVGWNACRAAMLQGADVSLTHEGKNHHEDKLGMVNHLGDVTEKVEPVTQIEPVADLYGLTSSTGGETSFTFDAVEARDFIDGGWSCQEYVELERFQEAVSGNSPVIQDGWVACVERMPSAGEKVLAYRPDAPESNDPLIKMATYVGGSAHGHGFDCYCKPTHWMPLPAAPQQEVNNG